MNDSNFALRTQDLSIGYRSNENKCGEKVLGNNLNLELGSGSLTCLLGRNGVGKSTLLQVLAGLQTGLSGDLFLGSTNIKDLTTEEKASRMAIVLTQVEHTGSMRVDELIALGRYPYTNWMGKLNKRDNKSIEQAITACECHDLVDRTLNSLSDGERQRCMIARALAQETDILLLDEPTAFLDLPSRARLMLLLRKLAKQRHLSILLSTHDLSLAMEAADQLWLMEDVENFHVGSPKELVENGILERVFNQDGIRFHPETGQLQLNIEK